MPLRFLYNILINTAWFVLKVIALFNGKIKLFVQGRRRTFSILEEHLTSNDKTIWMHVASLGEFEQGLPILERLRTAYPEHKLVLTFFSPFEIKLLVINPPSSPRFDFLCDSCCRVGIAQ